MQRQFLTDFNLVWSECSLEQLTLKNQSQETEKDSAAFYRKSGMQSEGISGIQSQCVSQGF